MNLLARNPDLAEENNLITDHLFRDEYVNPFLKMCLDCIKTISLKTVSLRDYINSGKGRIHSLASDRIAVIYAQGEIMYGSGDENVIGQELMIKSLKKARESKSVKAIVLRVNSPGGSALASDLIWRELGNNKKRKTGCCFYGQYGSFRWLLYFLQC